jgi:hypothetical protein
MFDVDIVGSGVWDLASTKIFGGLETCNIATSNI